MSKKKPDKLYLVHPLTGETVYVLARHAKGARSIAQQHLDDEGLSPQCVVEEAPISLKCRAINVARGRA
tara:strand:- start:13465 stop:13671 length:207 start_codon:yes stop_codon:yes gene_type:complete